MGSQVLDEMTSQVILIVVSWAMSSLMRVEMSSSVLEWAYRTWKLSEIDSQVFE